MFAFALYDPRIGRVYLVRDRLGIKPLYIADLRFDAGSTLLFASEVRALLATDLIDRRASTAGIESFLWNGFVAGPETIIHGVRRIDPGTWLEVDVTTLRATTHRYWRVPSFEVDHSISLEQLRGELSEATRLHLVSDVPLGVFLSGGIDSSAVSALAAKSAGSGLRTFNVAFDDSNYDESAYARRVATELGTDHSELRLTEDVFRAQLDDALSCIDQPTFDAINTYFVSRAVREAGIKVALAGTGGDELFGGYATFTDIPRVRRIAQIASRTPTGLRRLVGQLATRVAYGAPGAVRPQMRWAKLEHMLAQAGRLELYQLSYALFVPEFLEELQSGHSSNSTYFGLPVERARELTKWTRNEPDLPTISLLELACFLGERLLPDTDAASMAVSLEVRVPLLDHRFVELLSHVELSRRFEPIRKKLLLRDLALAEFPPTFFERPKSGFELPLGRWCRQELGSRVAAVLCDGEMCRAAGLDAKAVERLWKAFEQNAPGLYWSRVWSIFVLLDWLARHRVSI
jgi:asparagine synthase (glutamine-hydrolysing)